MENEPLIDGSERKNGSLPLSMTAEGRLALYGRPALSRPLAHRGAARSGRANIGAPSPIRRPSRRRSGSTTRSTTAARSDNEARSAALAARPAGGPRRARTARAHRRHDRGHRDPRRAGFRRRGRNAGRGLLPRHGSFDPRRAAGGFRLATRLPSGANMPGSTTRPGGRAAQRCSGNFSPARTSSIPKPSGSASRLRRETTSPARSRHSPASGSFPFVPFRRRRFSHQPASRRRCRRGQAKSCESTRTPERDHPEAEDRQEPQNAEQDEQHADRDSQRLGVRQMNRSSEDMDLPPRHQAVITGFFGHSGHADCSSGRLVVARRRPT